MNVKILASAIGIVLVFFVAVYTTAATLTESDTPLYTVRMEQISSKMKFFPTEMNNFIYTAKGVCALNCDVLGCSSSEPLSLTEFTCDLACPTEHDTCDGRTCDGTCWEPTCQIECAWTWAPTCISCHVYC